MIIVLMYLSSLIVLSPVMYAGEFIEQTFMERHWCYGIPNEIADAASKLHDDKSFQVVFNYIEQHSAQELDGLYGYLNAMQDNLSIVCFVKKHAMTNGIIALAAAGLFKLHDNYIKKQQRPLSNQDFLLLGGSVSTVIGGGILSILGSILLIMYQFVSFDKGLERTHLLLQHLETKLVHQQIP